MIFFYRVLTTSLYPILILLIFTRKFFKKEDSQRYKEKIYPNYFNIKKKKNFNLIWFHAASIGELKSILPIIKELDKKKNKLEFLITTTTLSSGNMASREIKRFNNVQHRFLPIDINFLIRKFLDLWKPKAIFLVDSEIWPNLILAANENKIPIALINARLTSKTFKKWMIFSNTAKQIFGSFNLCLTSNEVTKKYLLKFNAKNVFNKGNIKLINSSNKSKTTDPNIDVLKKKRFWCAISTHKGEEEICLSAHLKLREKFNNLITVIAPRHIHRVDEIKKMCNYYKLSFQILEKNEKILEDKQIIIINSYGILTIFLKYAKSIFMGKSMIKTLKNDSGQNPIEAARLGCKVYHGPYVCNFKDIYNILKKNLISQKIDGQNTLVKNLSIDLVSTKKNTRRFSILIDRLGKKILNSTMKKINQFLFYENR